MWCLGSVFVREVVPSVEGDEARFIMSASGVHLLGASPTVAGEKRCETLVACAESYRPQWTLLDLIPGKLLEYSPTALTRVA
jgi:hypothetical protein